jgi:hypothetical protein
MAASTDLIPKDSSEPHLPKFNNISLSQSASLQPANAQSSNILGSKSSAPGSTDQASFNNSQPSTRLPGINTLLRGGGTFAKPAFVKIVFAMELVPCVALVPLSLLLLNANTLNGVVIVAAVAVRVYLVTGQSCVVVVKANRPTQSNLDVGTSLCEAAF